MFTSTRSRQKYLNMMIGMKNVKSSVTNGRKSKSSEFKNLCQMRLYRSYSIRNLPKHRGKIIHSKYYELKLQCSAWIPQAPQKLFISSNRFNLCNSHRNVKNMFTKNLCENYPGYRHQSSLRNRILP